MKVVPEDVRRKRLVRTTIFWIIAGLAIIIGLILLLSSVVRNTDGDLVLDNIGGLLGAVFSSFGVLMVGVIPIMLKMLSNSEDVKSNVQNDHRKPDGTPLPMRDDMDDKHNEALNRMDRGFEQQNEQIQHVVDLVMATQSDTRGIRKDIARLTANQDRNTADIAVLVRTSDRADRIHEDLNKRIDSLSAPETDRSPRRKDAGK